MFDLFPSCQSFLAFATFPNDTPAQLGEKLGEVAVHEIGHVVGLRHVDDLTDIMSGGGQPPNATGVFANSPLSDVELPNGTIGTQDAPLLFNEIFGPTP